ncbi:MAG TPA: N-acetyl sugar amidotransferase [Candidatus Omnitrophota bacterium]|nr:N-acetyl sugar amidotransferase [Candidatus Omnitrophota bacterium]
MPDTRPEQVFDEHGICDACRSALRKKEIDWAGREKEFIEVLERYRNKNGTWWDCIIPVSGGKDSCFQAYTMKYKYGMNPLCVNHVPCEMTEHGKENLLYLRELGFDVLFVSANRKAYREMVRKGFFDLGDSCWPEHIGIFTAPIRVAVQYKVPLVIWGENSQFEYGGPAAKRENNYLDRNWLEQFQMYGYRISDLYEEGFDRKDLITFEYPSDKELKEVGVTGLFLGYYLPWNGAKNAEMMKSLGWKACPYGRVENAYFDYENLDCKWASGLHDYMKFLKYGYSRATDQLSLEIRRGNISRDKALRLARQYDGELPMRYILDFIKYLNITEEEFWATLDRFTNKKIFVCDAKGNLVKENGRLTKTDYGYDISEDESLDMVRAVSLKEPNK